MKKKKPKSKPKSKLIPVHIKLTHAEHEALKKRADWWALGNLSAWLRYAGLKYVPEKGEIIPRLISEKKS